MTSRDEALREIATIARAHGITSAQIASALSESDKAEPPKAAASRVLAYLGGVLITSGVCIFVGYNWDDMNSAARIVVTLGSGLALFAIALAALSEERFAAARTPLILISALLQPTGILVAINEFSSGGDWRHAALLTATILLVQQLLAFYRFRHAALLFTGITFGLWTFGIAFNLLAVPDELIAMTLGAGLVGLSTGLGATAFRKTTPLWMAIGSAAFLGGLFSAVERSPVELVFPVIAFSGIYLSTVLRSRVLLVVSTIAALGYISYFTERHFVDSIGWPLALIVLGVVMLGMSALAMRVSRRYIRTDPSRDQ